MCKTTLKLIPYEPCWLLPGMSRLCLDHVTVPVTATVTSLPGSPGGPWAPSSPTLPAAHTQDHKANSFSTLSLPHPCSLFTKCIGHAKDLKLASANRKLLRVIAASTANVTGQLSPAPLCLTLGSLKSLQTHRSDRSRGTLDTRSWSAWRAWSACQHTNTHGSRTTGNQSHQSSRQQVT